MRSAEHFKFISSILLFGMLCQNPVSAAPELSVDIKSGTASASDDSGNISMDFENASLKDILKVFSQLSRLNFVASQDIESKKATVYFDNVPIQDALNGLMSANDLRYEQKPGSKVFVVYSAASGIPTMDTHIYRIKYSRLSVSPVDVGGASSISELGSTQTASASGSSSTSGSGTGTAATTAAASTAANLKTGKGIDNVVASLLSKHGAVTVDLPSNSLIITDTPQKLADIEKVLAELDRPSPQVIIEVYLMEVQKDTLSNIGVEWGGDEGALASFSGPSRDTAFPFTERFLNVNKGVKATTQDATELTYGTISAANIAATLHYITTLGDTKILAKPRVLTMNNEAASIRLVTNAAVSDQTVTSSAANTATQTTHSAEREDVGISLNMTPQINRDGTIVLYIQPSLTSAADSAFFPGTFVDTTTRVVKTVARIKNHETLVIGGLLDNTNAETQQKFPFLGDLPIVGSAFNYKTTNHRDRELVIFITPHIVQGYDSKAAQSATSISGRDLQMKRAMDSAIGLEQGRAADALEPDEANRETAAKRERAQRAATEKREPVIAEPIGNSGLEISAEADRQMAQALQQAQLRRR